MTFANQVKAFQELEFFQNFMVFADKSLKIEEHIYRQLLMQQMEIKVGFNDYQTQVGKLKGLHFVSNLSNNKKEAFIKEVK